MRHDIPSESVDLIYLDPPFFTGKVQDGNKTNYLFKWDSVTGESKVLKQFLSDKLSIRGEEIKVQRSEDNMVLYIIVNETTISIRREKTKAILETDDGRIIALDIKEINGDFSIFQKSKWDPGAMQISYDDSKKFWKEKGIHEHAPEWLKHIAIERPDFGSYLFYMMERLKECHRVLKSTGSIYLHCDYNVSHYLKMIMDDVFGYNNFRNEIVWRIGWVSGYKTKKIGWIRNHDTIFYYVKSGKYTFNKKYIPYPKGYMRRDGKKPIGKGFPMEDTWNCHSNDVINSIGIMSFSKEKTGYPTQKPRELLERIIEASSNEGDIVLDPFCGCGTAVIKAHDLNRRWVGIDINKVAFDAISKNCNQTKLINPIKTTVVERTLEPVLELDPLKFEQWVNDFYNAKKPSPDRGVDGITPNGIPIQTKTYKTGYNIISQLLTDTRHHKQVPKPVKVIRVVSQKGFDDSARQLAYEIESTEKVKVELIEPKDMLKTEAE